MPALVFDDICCEVASMPLSLSEPTNVATLAPSQCLTHLAGRLLPRHCRIRTGPEIDHYSDQRSHEDRGQQPKQDRHSLHSKSELDEGRVAASAG